MRFALVFAAAALAVTPASAALAARPDCEPARCAVQEEINQQCPCDEASNHGRHVSCVAHVVKRLSRDGTIPINCKGKIKRCAARSTCGKPGRVTCITPREIGTCDLGSGTCVEDATLACAADADCVLSTRCSIKRTAELCEARGGTVGATSTCCANCPAP